jgi:hypothetical protein
LQREALGGDDESILAKIASRRAVLVEIATAAELGLNELSSKISETELHSLMHVIKRTVSGVHPRSKRSLQPCHLYKSNGSRSPAASLTSWKNSRRVGRAIGSGGSETMPRQS